MDPKHTVTIAFTRNPQGRHHITITDEKNSSLACPVDSKQQVLNMLDQFLDNMIGNGADIPTD